MWSMRAPTRDSAKANARGKTKAPKAPKTPTMGGRSATDWPGSRPERVRGRATKRYGQSRGQLRLSHVIRNVIQHCDGCQVPTVTAVRAGSVGRVVPGV